MDPVKIWKSLLSLSIFYLHIIKTTNGKCEKTIDEELYDFVVALLNPKNIEDSLQKYIDGNIKTNDTVVKSCFEFTTVVTLSIQEQLQIPTKGWTQIIQQTNQAFQFQAYNKNKSVIVGPYYTNVALMTERPEFFTPYIVTDYKGFDWVDENVVTNEVPWRSLLKIKPSPKDVNLAIVDLFKSKEWKSTFLIQPHNPMDNRECQDLMKQLITEEISPIPNSLKVRMRSKEEIKRDALKILRISQLLHMKVILVCSPRDEEQNLIHIMLEAAKEFHILDDDENTLVLVDTAFFYEPLRELNMYRNGLYSAKAQILAYRYTDEYSGFWDLSSALEATAVDAVEVIKQAKRAYLDAVSPQSEPHYSLNLSNFLTALRSSTLHNGRTGQVMFDAKGNRKNFTLHLYGHGGDRGLYHKEGIWSSEGSSVNDRLRLIETNNTYQQQSRGIFEDVVRVVVVVEEPFVMIDKDRSGNERFDGFTIDLLKAIAEKLQMNYEIYQSPGNMYGAEGRNGQWDGIVGEVVSGNATLGMGAISITSAREKVVDFSLGVITSGTNMLISKPKPKSTELFQFMKPFSLPLWMAIVGASAGLSFLYFVMDYSNEERLFTVRETLWFSIGTLLMRGTDFSPRRTSQRILTAGFTFFVLITVSTYTANLAAFLTRRSLEVPINSLEELAERSNFEVGTVRNSATMSFFQNGEKNIYRTIWERVVDSGGLVSNSAEGRERSAKGNFAFIFDYLINNYAEYTDCDTKMVGIPFRLQEHGIAMRQGASFKTRLNIALLQLKEAGKLADLKTKWWDNKRQCDIEAEKGTEVEFTLSHMAGVFIVGGFGLACSVAFFLFKKFYILTKLTAIKSKEQKDKISTNDKQKLSTLDTAVDV